MRIVSPTPSTRTTRRTPGWRAGYQLAGMGARRSAQAPANTISYDRAADPFTDGVRDARRLRARSDDRASDHYNPSTTAPALGQRAKR